MAHEPLDEAMHSILNTLIKMCRLFLKCEHLSSPDSSKWEELARYSGSDRQSYHHETIGDNLFSSPSDSHERVYVITIVSLGDQGSSWVKILPQTSPPLQLDSVYPSLPGDSSVRAVTRGRNILIRWEPADAVNQHWRRDVEYCVVVSRKQPGLQHNFRSHCGALAYLKGITKPKTVDFGFSERRRSTVRRRKERFQKNKKRKSGRKKFRRTKGTQLDSEEICVGDKTSFMYAKTKHSGKYFVDVFVSDKRSMKTSAYRGTSVDITWNPIVRMNVGQTKTVNLKRRDSVVFKIQKVIKKLGIWIMNPCSKKTKFEIFRNGEKLKSKTARGRHKFFKIRQAKPGTYTMTFPEAVSRKSFVTISLTSSSKRAHSQLTLPKKDKVIVWNKIKTCNHVTVSWLATRQEQTYCLYRKSLSPTGFDPRRDRCVSSTERPEEELYGCDVIASDDPHRQPVVRNVTGLDPATWYRIDVYVSYKGSPSVPLRSAKVKTLERCKG